LAIGDLLFGLMGRPNPGFQLASSMLGGGSSGSGPMAQAAMANAMSQGSQNQPALQGQGSPGGSGVPFGGPDGNQQPPQAPPQPMAYTTPPDLGQMYLQLMQRSQANQMINTGLGLMAYGASHSMDRGRILDAMQSQSAGTPDPNATLEGLGNIYKMQMQVNMQRAALQNLPAIGSKYGLDPATSFLLYSTGGLDKLIQAHEDAKITAATPLNQAQVAEANANAAKLNQELTTTQQMRSHIPVIAQALSMDPAVLSAMPTDRIADLYTEAQKQKLLQNAPLYQAQTSEAQQNAAKTAQDVQARTKLLQNVDAIAKATGIDSTVLSSLPPEQLATIAASSQTPTDAIKNYKQTRLALQQQGYDDATINTLAPPEVLVSGASADPTFRSYVVQHAAALKQAQNAASLSGQQPVADTFPSFEQFKANATTAAQVQSDVAKQQVAAGQQLPELQQQFDRLQTLTGRIRGSDVLDELTGPLAGRMPTTVAPILSGRSNTQQAIDLQNDINALNSMSFLEGAHSARQAVGGRVTNNEATAAQGAVNQLRDQTQSAGHYRDSLDNNLIESAKALAAMYSLAGQTIPDKVQTILNNAGASIVPPAIQQQYSTPPGQTPQVLRPMSEAGKAKAQQLMQRDGRGHVLQYLQQQGYDTRGL